MAVYAIALGSNRRHGRHGAPGRVLEAGIEALRTLGKVVAVSKIRSTRALGPAGRGFANAIALVQCDGEPDELLADLKGIEAAFGRRPGRKWGPRVLDLDIILWSCGPWAGPGPTIPHPEFRRRRFVLEPLVEVAPDWRDPISGATVRQLLFRTGRPRLTVDRAFP